MLITFPRRGPDSGSNLLRAGGAELCRDQHESLEWSGMIPLPHSNIDICNGALKNCVPFHFVLKSNQAKIGWISLETNIYACSWHIDKSSRVDLDKSYIYIYLNICIYICMVYWLGWYFEIT